MSGATTPYPIGDIKTLSEALSKIQQYFDEMYQERLGGALVGDVHSVGEDEILTLNISASGGLQKIGGYLLVKLNSADALILSSAGIGIADATATVHGAMPILSGNASDFLNGAGAWTVPGATHQFQYSASVADDATFTLPIIANAARGVMVAGSDEERADFSIKYDGTVNIIMASSNVVANADTDAKVCLGTSVASPVVIKNRLGAAKIFMVQIWYG